MADPFADPDDVAAIWRPLSAAEQITALALLVGASAMIRAQYPGIDDQVTSGAVDAGTLTFVAASMVKTAMIGPTAAAGATQTSQTVGPYSMSASYANPTGNLFLTAAMDLMIRGYRPSAVSGKFSNDTTNCGFSGALVYGEWDNPVVSP